MHCFYCEEEISENTIKVTEKAKFPVFDIRHQTYFEIEIGKCPKCDKRFGVNWVKILHLQPNQEVRDYTKKPLTKEEFDMALAKMGKSGKLRDLE